MKNIEIIKDNKFKGIYLSINFQMPIDSKKIANNIVWATVLPKINSVYSTERELELELANLYDATYGVSVEKIGDLYNIEFRLECLNSNYLPNNEKVFSQALKIFKTLLYEPKISNNKFNSQIVERQKQYFLNILKKQKDDKRNYAIGKLFQELEKGEPSEIFLYSTKEEINNVTPETAVQAYRDVLKNSQIKIILSGNIEDYMLSEIEKNLNFTSTEYNLVDKNIIKEKKSIINEKADSNQSILGIGCKINNYSIKDSYKYMVLNNILGQGSNSKLFLNVREKNSLAYYIYSTFKKIKGEIVIITGINYKDRKKAEELILEQILELSKGNITDDELNQSKMSLISNTKQLEEDIGLLAKKSLYNNLIYGFNTPISEMIQEINKVTKEDVINLSKNINIQVMYFYEGVKNED